MSVPAASAGASGAADQDAVRARSLATTSILMIPMLVVSAIVAAVFALFWLGRRDLDGSEPMSVQGGYGWMVWIVSTAILLIPVVIGVVFGFKARRLGAGRRAWVGIILNGVILIGYPILSFIGLLRQ